MNLTCQKISNYCHQNAPVLSYGSFKSLSWRKQSDDTRETLKSSLPHIPSSPRQPPACPLLSCLYFLWDFEKKRFKEQDFQAPLSMSSTFNSWFQSATPLLFKGLWTRRGWDWVKGWTTKLLAFTVTSSLEIQIVKHTQAPINKTANIWKEEQKHSKWPFFIYFFNQARAVISSDESLIDILKYYFSLCSHYS